LFAFERRPAFHETKAFLALVIMAASAMVFMVVRLRLRQLKQRERVLISLVRERTEELEVANTTLKRMSLTDPLTGSANRRHYEEHLHSELRRAHRDQSWLSVLLIDVDFFKLYNDRYGHQAGDECLRRVAPAIGACIYRAGDLVARYGGEEFVVVLPNCNSAGAIATGETIRRQVMAEELLHEGSSVANVVTVSIGAASAIPQDAQGGPEWVAAADAALYDVKRQCRNAVLSRSIQEVAMAAA